MDPCDFSEADTRGTKFARSEMTQSRFHNMSLADCDFRDAKVLGGDFNHAVLAGAIRERPTEDGGFPRRQPARRARVDFGPVSAGAHRSDYDSPEWK